MKKKMLKTGCVLILFIVCSCISPAKKTVLLPLKSNQIDRIVFKDSSFIKTYTIASKARTKVTLREDSLIFIDLSYEKFHKFIKLINDSTYNKTISDSLSNIWDKQFLKYNIQADSIINYWQEYIKSNSPDSLLSVEYCGVEFEKIKNLSGEIEKIPNLRLKVKPLKANIDSLVIFYSISKRNETPIYIYLFNGEMNFFKVKKAIYDSINIKVLPYLFPSTLERIEENDTSYVLKHYVHSLNIRGKNFNVDSLRKDIPISILNYLNYKDTAKQNPLIESALRDSIMLKFVDKNFELKNTFLEKNIESIYKNEDVISYLFYKLTNK